MTPPTHTPSSFLTRPGRELPKVWRDIATMLVDQQGWTYRYKRKGGSHPRVVPPEGGLGVALPTTVTDGDAGHRASYLTALKRAGAVLDAAPTPRRPGLFSDATVGAGTDDAPMTINGVVEVPWTEREWREMQRDSGVWWRAALHGAEPEPEPAPEPAPIAPRIDPYVTEVLRRLDAPNVRDDAQGNGRYTLAEARQQIRDGYSLETVIKRTGYGRLWLADVADRLAAG